MWRNIKNLKSQLTLFSLIQAYRELCDATDLQFIEILPHLILYTTPIFEWNIFTIEHFILRSHSCEKQENVLKNILINLTL